MRNRRSSPLLGPLGLASMLIVVPVCAAIFFSNPRRRTMYWIYYIRKDTDCLLWKIKYPYDSYIQAWQSIAKCKWSLANGADQLGNKVKDFIFFVSAEPKLEFVKDVDHLLACALEKW